MKIIPHTRQAWVRFILFPFKAYIVLAPIGFFVWRNATNGHRFRGASVNAAGVIALGLFLGMVIMAIAALVQLIARGRKEALINAAYAMAAFLYLYFYLMRFLAA